MQIVTDQNMPTQDESIKGATLTKEADKQIIDPNTGINNSELSDDQRRLLEHLAANGGQMKFEPGPGNSTGDPMAEMRNRAESDKLTQADMQFFALQESMSNEAIKTYIEGIKVLTSAYKDSTSQDLQPNKPLISSLINKTLVLMNQELTRRILPVLDAQQNAQNQKQQPSS